MIEIINSKYLLEFDQIIAQNSNQILRLLLKFWDEWNFKNSRKRIFELIRSWSLMNTL